MTLFTLKWYNLSADIKEEIENYVWCIIIFNYYLIYDKLRTDYIINTLI